MSTPLDTADLVHRLHDAVVDHAQALAQTPGATPFSVAVCLLSVALGLLENPDVCPPAVARGVLQDLLRSPAPPALH